MCKAVSSLELPAKPVVFLLQKNTAFESGVFTLIRQQLIC